MYTGRVVLELRLTQGIPDDLATALGKTSRKFGTPGAVYRGVDVDMNPHGAVMIWMRGSWLGVKPSEFEWMTVESLLEQRRLAGGPNLAEGVIEIDGRHAVEPREDLGTMYVVGIREDPAGMHRVELSTDLAGASYMAEWFGRSVLVRRVRA